MADFGSAVITDAGASLLATVMAGSKQIEFTALTVGDGTYTAAEKTTASLQAMTALKNQRLSFAFSNITVQSNTAVRLKAVVSNITLLNGFYVNEVGIWAKDASDALAEPILYSIVVADTADYLPAYNGSTPSTIEEDWYTTISNSITPTIEVSQSAYALASDLLDLEANLPGQISNQITTALETTFGKDAGFANARVFVEDIDEITDEMWASIANGTFDKVHVGMRYTAPSGRKYYFAHADYWLHCGDTECTTHHMVLVPVGNLESGPMNASNVTTGAYIGSVMKSASGKLADAKTMIVEDFGADHILTHREFFANAVSNGKQTAGAWYDSDVDLMNEEMVYGCPIFTPANDGTTVPYNYTIDKSQLALFANRPDLITTRAYWWLRDVVSGTLFAIVAYGGGASYTYASASFGVRPAFAIC